MSYYWFKFVHFAGFISWMAMLFYMPRLYVYHAENLDKPDFVKVVKKMERGGGRGRSAGCHASRLTRPGGATPPSGGRLRFPSEDGRRRPGSIERTTSSSGPARDGGAGPGEHVG